MKIKVPTIRTKPKETEEYTLFVEDIRTLTPKVRILKFSNGGKRRKSPDTPPPQDPINFPKMIRVLLVNNRVGESREKYREYIMSQPDMTVVGEATTAQEAIDLYGRLRPDVVSIGYCSSNSDIETAAILTSKYPEANVLLVMFCFEEKNVISALYAGVIDFLILPVDKEEYVSAIRYIARIYSIESDDPDDFQEKAGTNEEGCQVSNPGSQRDNFSSPTDPSLADTFYEDSPKQTISLEEINKLWGAVNSVRRQMGKIPVQFSRDKLENPHFISAFDANKMLSAFDRVRLQDGYTLDYVYAPHLSRGEPFLYARAEDERSIMWAEEYCEGFNFDLEKRLRPSEASPENTKPYLPYLTFSQDPEGYFQMAMFVMIAGRFYLSPVSDRHRRLYFTKLDHYYKCIDRMGMVITDEEYEKLRYIAPTVTVQMNGDYGKLKIMTYKPIQGFSFLHVHLKWPNELIKIEDEMIVTCRGLI